MVTTLVADVVPQRPVDVAVIVAAPEKAADQFMVPVTGFIIPAVPGVTVYTIEVELRAVAVYVSSGASWQRVTAPALNAVGPVDGFTVTMRFAVVTPQRPVDVAVMVATPEKAASQFMTPLAAFITPAAAGATV